VLYHILCLLPVIIRLLELDITQYYTDSCSTAMHADWRTMTSFSVAKVKVIYVIVGALLNASYISAAFRIYDVEEVMINHRTQARCRTERLFRATIADKMNSTSVGLC